MTDREPEESPKYPVVLKQPGESAEDVFPWTVTNRSKAVVAGWECLFSEVPENAVKCCQHLRFTPMIRKPKRVFPLKYEFRGAWKYEVSAGHRVFYIPNEEAKTVDVYYAGRHPRQAPKP